MPRSAHNNPTERIMRLLDEFEALSTSYDTLAELLARKLSSDEFETLPPKPNQHTFVSEMTRQKLAGRQTQRNRESMQRQRLRKVIADQIEEKS